MKEISVTPTITAGVYAANDAVGGLMTFAGASRPRNYEGTIVKVKIVDDAIQHPILDLFLFKSAPSVIADNDPYIPTDADMQLCLGAISIEAADWVDGSNNAIAWVDVDFEFILADFATSLFGQLKAGDTPTFAATDDITVTLVIE